MIAQPTVFSLLIALQRETTQLFYKVIQQSQLAGIENNDELTEIGEMINDMRYATARVYLETIQERLPN